MPAPSAVEVSKSPEISASANTSMSPAELAKAEASPFGLKASWSMPTAVERETTNPLPPASLRELAVIEPALVAERETLPFGLKPSCSMPAA